MERFYQENTKHVIVNQERKFIIQIGGLGGVVFFVYKLNRITLTQIIENTDALVIFRDTHACIPPCNYDAYTQFWLIFYKKLESVYSCQY